MIIGTVDENLDPRVSLEVSNGTGEFRSKEFVVDTGFQGDLALPADAIVELGLSRAGNASYASAMGEETNLPMYLTVVSWHGHQRAVHVIEADDALLGTELLLGSRLTVDFREGGEVLIEEGAPAG